MELQDGIFQVYQSCQIFVPISKQEIMKITRIYFIHWNYWKF